MTARSGGLNKLLVDGRINATGSDATPNPASAASDETTPPAVSSDAPVHRRWVIQALENNYAVFGKGQAGTLRNTGPLYFARTLRSQIA
ncbi:hypothetical protein GFPCMMHI_05419 [Ensifer adhaerens]|jgi:hypothetical protein|nr:hypothetical protein [Ensifer adhaerens]